MRLLFVCTNNLMRSPTAARLAEGMPGVEARSAGVAPTAAHVVTRRDVEWADWIFAMETWHAASLQHRFGDLLAHRRLTVLSIPDQYGFMDPELVRLLRRDLRDFLGTRSRS